MPSELLDEYDRADTEWVEDVREKIDAAISASEQTPPIDGETFVSQVLERFGASASDTKMSRYVINIIDRILYISNLHSAFYLSTS